MSAYLSMTEVMALHRVVVGLYGGLYGIRDMGALQSAVSRPSSGYYADSTEEAIALLESLLINHPFVDGNKRAAFAACDVFLRINGLHIAADWKRLYALVIHWITLASNERFRAMVEELRLLTMER